MFHQPLPSSLGSTTECKIQSSQIKSLATLHIRWLHCVRVITVIGNRRKLPTQCQIGRSRGSEKCKICSKCTEAELTILSETELTIAWMLLSDSVIVIVEKLLPFKSLFLLVNASFRRRKNIPCAWCGHVPPPHKHHTFLVGTPQRQNPWPTKVWGSVPSHMPTMSTFVRGGNRQNPGNQNERPYQPQHPTHSSGGPLSWTWSCDQ